MVEKKSEFDRDFGVIFRVFWCFPSFLEDFECFPSILSKAIAIFRDRKLCSRPLGARADRECTGDNIISTPLISAKSVHFMVLSDGISTDAKFRDLGRRRRKIFQKHVFSKGNPYETWGPKTE